METTLVALFGFAIWLLPGCRTAGPPPTEYVLGPMPEPTGSAVPEGGLPLIEVERVRVPGYLDRTAILERRGNLLVPSSTGRWGERLSVGFTRALSTSLSRQLPGMLVDAAPPIGRPARQLLVDVVAFESRADRDVILVARWTVADGDSRQILTSQQTSLVEPIVGGGDAAVVKAMSRAVEDFAHQVAVRIKLNP